MLVLTHCLVVHHKTRNAIIDNCLVLPVTEVVPKYIDISLT